MTAESRAARAVWLAFAACAVVLGAYLRTSQLGGQILLDDEWHAIHKLLAADARDIATHFGLADYSIPLTLYYRFLYVHGGLGEWGMRLPMLLAGIALVAVGPWLMRRQAGAATIAVWSGLMAISPFMVYHSRTARPYALTTLLVFVAVVAFRAWWREGKRGWGALYVACAFLAGWLHLITLPFTLLPFLFCGIAALAQRDGRGVVRLVGLGLALAVPLAVALAPPLMNDWGALAGKTGTGAVTFASVYRSLLLCLGVADALPFAALAALLVAGAARWCRRDAAFVGYVATIVLGTAAAVAWSHPAWVQHPGTYARYLQPAVPFLLLFVAEGFAVCMARLAVSVQAPLAAAALAALVFAGPIPGYWYDPNQFMGHPYFQFDYDPAHNDYRTLLPTGPVPEFYRRLATQPPRSLTLIEAPWSLQTDHDPEELYQAVHRQYVKIGLVTPLCGVRDYGEYPPGDTGMRLANFVHLATLQPGAEGDLLVMHLAPWPATLPPPPQWPDLSVCLPELERRFGAPVYRDADVEAFALTPAGRAAVE
ncbi:MAG TPA: hypothetical protein VFB32_05505 [Rudaea sp.]|nr:hypothetical protein [Rudaea sp.]